MSEPVPATPAAPAAAAPGTQANVITPPSTVPPAVPEGKVTIGATELAQLQRDAARGRSAQRRADLNGGRTAAPVAPTGNADVDQQIQAANQKALDAEVRATQAEIRIEVRDLLDKEEFKVLPKSTKDLILKNPALLSEATTKEEAMLDIEDYVRDQVAAMGTPTVVPAPGSKEPDKVETPPSIGGGAPAAAGANEPEDLTKLRGPARSQAAIRNAMKAKAAGQS